MTPSRPPSRPGDRDLDLFVRRIEDEPRRWRKPRAWYEVGAFPPGGTVPVTVERTTTPGSVLLHNGMHTTDIWDYLHNADAAWRGGGPWRGMYPDVGPS